MIITEEQLRKLIKRYILNNSLNLNERLGDRLDVYVPGASGKEIETKLVRDMISRKVFSGSKGLSSSVLKIDADLRRGEVYIHLEGSGREASDREVACSISNFIKTSSQKLKLKWLVKPCRYDDKNKRKMILIAGI